MIQTSDLPRHQSLDGSVHDRTYMDMLRYIVEYGDFHADRTGVGTKSVFGYQNVYDLSKGFPLLTTKKMFMRGIVEELRWFLLGRTDNQWLQERQVKIWDEWATKEQCAKFGRKAGDLGPVYGHQWREFGAGHIVTSEIRKDNDIIVQENTTITLKGIDQIKNLCDDLLKNPGSRRMIVTGWNPAEAPIVALPPCHTMFQCKVREKAQRPSSLPEGEWKEVYRAPDAPVDRYLDLQLYQRSADSFLGVPFNIASYALLTHLLAKVSGLKPGRFIHTFGDLHIYTNHKDQVIEQLSRQPKSAPTLRVDSRYAGKGFEGLMEWASGKDMEGLWLDGYDPHPAIKAEVAV